MAHTVSMSAANRAAISWLSELKSSGSELRILDTTKTGTRHTDNARVAARSDHGSLPTSRCDFSEPEAWRSDVQQNAMAGSIQFFKVYSTIEDGK